MEAIFSEKDDLLKKENKLNNDYDEIVRVFYDGRGLILMDRFGV